MTRRCSHCSNNGHNSRTCPNRGVKLFGVRLTDGPIRKSASMGNLSHYAGSGHHTPDSPADGHDGGDAADGYASDDLVQGSSSSCRERKKGVPWTEEEHRMFLLGLQKLGKGDWRGIARNFVVSRTPTQVASHAQKYFIRQSNFSRRKRRSSLFDIVADETVDNPSVSRDLFLINHQEPESQSSNSLIPSVLDEECEPMESTPSNDVETSKPMLENLQCTYPVPFPAYFSPYFPFPLPFWPGCMMEQMESETHEIEHVERETHEILKPTAVHSKSSINVDELVGMSNLSLGESAHHVEPGRMASSALSSKLLEGSTRQSAFQANPASGSSSMKASSPIHAL